METTGRELTVTRHGRHITIQSLTETDRFLALIGLGVREVHATAILAKLITVRVDAVVKVKAS